MVGESEHIISYQILNFGCRLLLIYSWVMIALIMNEQSLIEHTSVAERILHSCLARNLIRLLGLTRNFTQSGWLILFSQDYLSGQHKLGKSTKHFFLQNFFVQNRCLTVFSSIAAAASHHHEGNNLIYGPLASISLRPRIPSWIWIR